MSAPDLTCRQETRRNEVRAAQWNGLDYLEVGSDQLTLEVFFLGHAPEEIRRENFLVLGGRRIRDIRVTDLRVHTREDPELDDTAVLTVDRAGDFSTYTLRVVAVDPEGRPTGETMPGFDPRYDRIDFSFKADCPSELDCKPQRVCPEPGYPAPEISYLAKDYASFRRLALDRLAVTLPEWRERHVPDLGIALVELLAYAADHLSYYQDAVATEAYLGTARQRISVRRHARLVDYAMHEGTNARAWVTLRVEAEKLTLPPAGFEPEDFDFCLVTGFDGAPPPGTLVAQEELPEESPRPYEVFEPVAAGPIELYAAHNEISFYTWGDHQCCLPRGATRATLKDPGLGPVELPKGEEYPPAPACDEDDPPPPPPRHALHLQPGDVLIFEEVKGAKTCEEADADPRHRHAVRLTRAEPAVDPLNGQPIVEIEWHEDDALPFPLCLSALVYRPEARGECPSECQMCDDVSVARGNVILVDHGRRIVDEALDPVPEDERRFECEEEGRAVEREPRRPRFRPKLLYGPLVFAEPYDSDASAHAALERNPRRAPPWIELTCAEHAWDPRPDLLGSGGDDRHYVAEVDNTGCAVLRFGDGELGRRPEPGGVFRATYRVARATEGNVGAETIRHLVLRRGKLEGETIVPRNPMAACGGRAPEPLHDVKLLAPHAFRADLERAVTAEDYARLAEENPGVQRAAARLRWSGCSYKVLVAIDPRGGTEADDETLREVAAYLAPYRRMGHEVLVGRAEYVPLDVALVVCVKEGYLRGHVLAAVLDRLSTRLLPDGRRGFFHPDELTFGAGVYLSELVAAVQSVPGVENVPTDPSTTRFRRYGEAADGEIEDGVLELGPFEVARLDNDPSFPENGVLKLEMRGGR